MKRPRRPRRTGQAQLHNMVRSIDNLAVFDEFEKKIREQLAKGLSPKQIFEHWKPIVAALQVKAALGDGPDAMTARKDILDRAEGKAKESKEVRHKLGELPEEQIDALLITKLADMEKAKNEK